MKKHYVPFCILVFLMISKKSLPQYGGYTLAGYTNYLGAGCIQGVFTDITYNDGSITSHPSSTVNFVGSAPNMQHQVITNIGGASATQIGNVILNNGTGGLFINNAATGLKILTNFNFNGQNAQVSTLRNASAVADNNLLIGANATITGSNAANNVNGYIKKEGDGTGFIFPVADGSVYAPLTTGALGAGNSFTAAYYKSSANTAAAFQGGPFLLGSLVSPILSASPQEYWDITTNGSPNASLTLLFQGDYSVASIATLYIVGWRISIGKWEQIPSNPATGLTPGNTITSSGTVNFSDYSAFTLAATTYVLPLTVVSFNAYRISSNRVLLSWVTAGENNLNDYIVERSANGNNNGWVSIGKRAALNAVNGGTYKFEDDLPVAGNNYYRLRITDKEGKITYSTVRLLVFTKAGFSIELYPNPVSRVVTIGITGNINKTYTIQLADATGKIVQQKKNAITGTKYQFEVSNYAKGIYYIKLVNEKNTLIETKEFIKQ